MLIDKTSFNKRVSLLRTAAGKSGIVILNNVVHFLELFMRKRSL